jgi:hypothetical protein
VPPAYGNQLYGAPPPPPYGQQYGSPPPYGQQYGQQPGYPAFTPVAPKPGIIPLRPLAVGEILDGAFTTIRRHPKATLGLSAVFACAQQGLDLGVRALTGTLTSSGGAFSGTSFTFGSTSSSNGGDLAATLVAVFAEAMISLIVGGLLTALLCLVVSDSVLGQPSSAGGAWQRLRPFAWRAVGAALLIALIEGVGLVCCVLPGVFLWGALALTMPALVLERVSVGTALRRSWRLVTPSFWRTWGIRALSVIIAGAVSVPFSAIIIAVLASDATRSVNDGSSSVHLSTLTVVVMAVVSVITTTLTAPFLAGIVTLLYVDRRIRAEALDVQLQQSAAAAVAPTAYG